MLAELKLHAIHVVQQQSRLAASMTAAIAVFAAVVAAIAVGEVALDAKSLCCVVWSRSKRSTGPFLILDLP